MKAEAQSSLCFRAQDVNRTRIHQEFELVFKELVKARDYEQNRHAIPYQKLQHHDPEKWKKKLKMLLDRERIISFEGHAGGLDIRKFARQFKASSELVESVSHCKAIGAEILATPKFWVLVFCLAGLKRVDNGIGALKWVQPSSENFELLRSFLEVPEAEQPILCDTNPFAVGTVDGTDELPDETLNNS